MSTHFKYDVFLSHSATDKPVVRELANRLKQDGLRVWLDEWEIKPGDMIGLKIQQGLGRSSIIRCCSAIRPMLSAGSFRCSLKIAKCLMLLLSSPMLIGGKSLRNCHVRLHTHHDENIWVRHSWDI